MKRFLIMAVILLGLTANVSYGDMLTAYPQNTNPLTTDEALGLDDPAGTWGVNRFAFGDIFTLYLTQDFVITGSLDATGTSSTSLGPLNFTSGATLPTSDGQFRFNTGVTGLTGSIFTFYDTALNYILSYETLPTTTGEVPTYNATTDTFDWAIPAGGGTNITEAAVDPTFSSMDSGDLVVSIDTGDMFYKSATGGYTFAGIYTVDPVIPTMISATIPTAGTTISLLFSEALTEGAGGNGGWTLNTPTNAMTYSSGDTTDTWIYTLASTIDGVDTPTITYTQPGNGLESSTGEDLESIVAGSVINNSTQGVCAGGSDGLIGYSTQAGDIYDAAANIVTYERTTADEDGSVTFAHGFKAGNGSDYRIGIWSSTGTLLASTAVESGGGDGVQEAVHAAIQSSFCLVAATEYITGIWRPGAFESMGMSAITGTTDIYSQSLPTFGDFTPTDTVVANQRRLTVQLNNTAGAFE